MNQRILISGAGIAGATAAWWLLRGGFDVTVVERAPAPRRGGQTVDLRGAGRTVVERMGLLEQVRRCEVDQAGIAWVDRRGRHRAEMPVDAFGGRGVVSRDEILRGDLADVLLAAAQRVGSDGGRGRLELVFDDTVTAVRPDETTVEVEFERRRSDRFGLVVGADGLHSAVRRCAFGPEADHVRSLDLLTAWFTMPAELDLDGWFVMHNAPGGRVVSVRPGRLPQEQKVSLSVRTRRREELPDRRDRPAQLAFLNEKFADVGWEAGRALAAAAQADDLYLENVGQVVMPRWSTGRSVLVGDAGYSPSMLTGLGTSVALVGAYVLAGELATHGLGAGLPTALERYERILRPYVAQAQALPPGGAAGYAPRSSLTIALGAASMRWSTRWPLRGMFERIFAKADAIDLPHYSSGSRRTGATAARIS